MRIRTTHNTGELLEQGRRIQSQGRKYPIIGQEKRVLCHTLKGFLVRRGFSFAGVGSLRI